MAFEFQLHIVKTRTTIMSIYLIDGIGFRAISTHSDRYERTKERRARKSYVEHVNHVSQVRQHVCCVNYVEHDGRVEY